MRLNNTIKLVFLIVLFESIGFYLGLLTQANIYPWYQSLQKSSLTPPGFVFSIVWSSLYALLAVIAWMLLNHNKHDSRKITILFAIQMLMNWAWTPLFFEYHWLTLSAVWLIGLTALNLILIIVTRTSNKTIAWLLSPYLLWLMFASYLNVVIACMN